MTEFISSIGPAVANHLWQSTVFAVTVWLVTLLLRLNPARVRFSLWLTASVKFLVPFSLLVGLGGMLPRPQRMVTVAPAAVYSAMDAVVVPFSGLNVPAARLSEHVPSLRERATAALPMVLAAVWLCGMMVVLLVWCVRWWRVSAMRRRAVAVESAREVEILRQMGGGIPLRLSIPLLLSRDLMEPGIFGIFRPALLWPEQLSERLDDEHIEAILAHELEHVRRRDNLTATMHMVVEAAFWFHPMVWWIERRMVEEREQACDEAVVAMGGSAEAYAESLLKACRFCVESPMMCVSGITGADLKKRIVQIMAERSGRNLSFGKKLLLVMAAVAVVAGPVVFGLAYAAQVRAQDQAADMAVRPPEFEVATIKPSKDTSGDSGTTLFGNEYEANNKTLEDIIRSAYGITSGGKDRLSGGPGWINSTRFDIKAKLAESDVAELQKLPREQQLKRSQLMLQALLADRFKLKVHHETKELPVYVLTVAKSSPKLTPSSPSESQNQHGVRAGRGQITGMDAKLDTFVNVLGMQPEIGRLIFDKTGLTGSYDFTLRWTPEGMAGRDSALPPDSSWPSLFTALQEQLGLKLELSKGPVDTIVIDSVEMPSAN